MPGQFGDNVQVEFGTEAFRKRFDNQFADFADLANRYSALGPLLAARGSSRKKSLLGSLPEPRLGERMPTSYEEWLQKNRSSTGDTFFGSYKP